MNVKLNNRLINSSLLYINHQQQFMEKLNQIIKKIFILFIAVAEKIKNYLCSS